MNPIIALGVFLMAVSILLGGFILFSGEGGFQRMTTISGIYTVEKPGGHPVVCFVDKSSKAMDCVPYSQMK